MSRQASQDQQPAERRRFCRIDDDIVLRYRVIGMQETPVDIQNLDVCLPNRLTLSSTFTSTTQQMQPLLAKIQEQSLEVAEYLRLIDRKLDLVARAFLLQEINVQEEPICRVNLSAGGIGFYEENPLAAGATLEMELILLPSYVGILAYGKVAYRKHEPDVVTGLPFRIGVEFCKLRERDRDLIANHVLSREPETRSIEQA